MVLIGFHASHEQLHPRVLLDDAVHAERAGFDAVMCSDHLAPWTQAQGHSGFTWTWLGAALQATDRIPMGAFHAPGQRYHPVISAQAMATVAAMFPGRLPWVALGSGEWADGLITANQPPETLRRIVDAYRGAGGRGTLRLQVHLAYADSDDEALAIAVDQWRGNCVPTLLAWDLTTPEQFEAATRHVPASEVAANVRVSSDLGRHLGWLQEYVDLGFRELYLHHVGQRNEAFIDAFGAAVLPSLRGEA